MGWYPSCLNNDGDLAKNAKDWSLLKYTSNNIGEEQQYPIRNDKREQKSKPISDVSCKEKSEFNNLAKKLQPSVEDGNPVHLVKDNHNTLEVYGFRRSTRSLKVNAMEINLNRNVQDDTNSSSSSSVDDGNSQKQKEISSSMDVSEINFDISNFISEGTVSNSAETQFMSTKSSESTDNKRKICKLDSFDDFSVRKQKRNRASQNFAPINIKKEEVSPEDAKETPKKLFPINTELISGMLDKEKDESTEIRSLQIPKYNTATANFMADNQEADQVSQKVVKEAPEKLVYNNEPETSTQTGWKEHRMYYWSDRLQKFLPGKVPDPELDLKKPSVKCNDIGEYVHISSEYEDEDYDDEDDDEDGGDGDDEDEGDDEYDQYEDSGKEINEGNKEDDDKGDGDNKEDDNDEKEQDKIIFSCDICGKFGSKYRRGLLDHLKICHVRRLEAKNTDDDKFDKDIAMYFFIRPPPNYDVRPPTPELYLGLNEKGQDMYARFL